MSTSRAPTRVGRPSAAATTASAAVTPTLPADRTAAALAAYRRFWDVAQTLDRRPAAEWRAVLSQVAAEPVLSRVLAGFESRVRAGYRQFGTVITRPVVVESGAAAVAVLDCQDASGSGEIDTSTGLPTNVGRARTPVAATMTRGADGRWRVSDARYLDGTC